MPQKRTNLWVIAILILIVTFLVGCSQNSEPTNISSPTEEVATEEETNNTVDEATAEPVTEEPARGGSVRIALYQEPSILNPYLIKQGAATRVMITILEGLLSIDPEGNYYPVLAEEVPTIANGGVSADGLEVTHHLRPDILWSDGETVKADDVVFTWNAVMNSDNQVITRSGYDKIESIEAIDDVTVVVRFSEYYAPYLTLFEYVLPEHVLGDAPDMNSADFNRSPVGTGPFMVEEWVPGDYIILIPNPFYREVGKPYLDQLIFKIVPSRETGVSMLKTGEVEVMWDLVADQIPQIEEEDHLNLWVSPSINIERLILNLAHPALGDIKVRQAINAAIDKQQIVDAFLFGQGKLINSPIPIGWAADDSIPLSDFDPTVANELLDEAGWFDSDGDGIREKDGVVLQLTIMSTSGNSLRERIEQVLQAELKTVGIDLQINNVASSVLFGSWADDSPRATGNFDMMLYATGPKIDPDAHLFSYFHSSQIPSDENGGKGANYSHYSNPEVDAALDAARSNPDLDIRRSEYNKVAGLIAEDLPHIMLYARLSINVFNTNVTGYTVNAWQNLTWDTQTWNLISE